MLYLIQKNIVQLEISIDDPVCVKEEETNGDFRCVEARKEQ
jgi:hypothetical protein